MNTNVPTPPTESALSSCSAFLLPLDLAMIRWSVRCRTWQEMSAGSQPELGPFLAGWFCRCIGAGLVVDGQFRDSFRIGWKEADDQIAIEDQKATPVADYRLLNAIGAGEWDIYFDHHCGGFAVFHRGKTIGRGDTIRDALGRAVDSQNSQIYQPGSDIHG